MLPTSFEVTAGRAAVGQKTAPDPVVSITALD